MTSPSSPYSVVPGIASWILGALLLFISSAASAQQPICDNCGTNRRAYDACKIYSSEANALALSYGHPTRWTCSAITHPGNNHPAWSSHHVDYDPNVVGTGATFYWHGAAPPKSPKAEGTPDCSKECGNPVDLGSANKFQREVDVDHSELLRFERFYNSESANSQRAMGRGWSHFYDRSISEVSGASPQQVSVLRHDGQQLQFRKIGGTWTPDADIASSLQEVLDGSGNRIGWLYAPVDARELESYSAQGALVSIARADGSRVDLTYSAGRLDAVTDENGRQLEFTHNAAGNIVSMEDSSGNAHGFSYDSSNRLESVTRPGESSRLYHYGERDYGATSLPYALTGITDERGNRFATFRYHHYFGATGTSHAEGADNYDVDYLTNGSAVVSLPAGGTRTLQFSLIHGLRRVTSDSLSCTGCTTRTKYFTHDAQGRLDTETDAAGTITDFNFDTQGRLLQRTDSANVPATRRTVQTDWHAGAYRVPLETRIYDNQMALVVRRTWSYNGRGQVVTASMLSPDAQQSRTTTYAYCESTDVSAPGSVCPILGYLKSVDGPRTGSMDTTTYSYYSADDLTGCATGGACHRKGDLHRVTDAAGHVTTYTRYDLAGRLLQSTDANGVVTDLEYNARGWLTARKVRGTNNTVETDDAITRMVYDNVGQVTELKAPDGADVGFVYDAARRLTHVFDVLGNNVTYTLDGAGNRVREETRDHGNALRHSLSRLYDQLGQLETVADAFDTPSDFTYDAAGNLDTVTDALGRTSNNDYDALNRLRKSIANTAGSGATRPVSEFAYDARDNLVTLTDPKGLDTTYSYDGLNDLVELDSPDTGITAFTHDSAGNRNGQIDARGIELVYSHDALNRLTEIRSQPNLPGGGTVLAGFNYDTAHGECLTNETFAAGRLSGFTDQSGYTRYCYDRRGNVTRKAQTNSGGASRTIAYAHNAAGRLQSVVYPSGMIVTYSRASNGQVTGVTGRSSEGDALVSLVSSVTYNPFGPIQKIIFGSGRSLDKTYDQNYGIDTISEDSFNGINIDYTLDGAGKVVGLDERVGGSNVNRTIEYDAVDRLTALKDGNGAVQSFDYDATGNRTSKVSGSSATYLYGATNHRLTKVGTVDRAYDAAGNSTVIGTRNFQYDEGGRMSRVLNGTTVSRDYRYNALGQRVAKLHPTTATSSIYYVYDEAGKLMGEYQPNGTLIREYIWLDGTLVATRGAHAGQAFQYVLTDHLDTPRAVVLPSTDTIVWRWDLTGSAFGEHPAQSDPDDDANTYTFNLRYPGQYFDSETGLHYNYFRDFDPGTGRYVQSDPIGLVGGVSTFAYVNSSPVMNADPFGLETIYSVGGQTFHAYPQGGARSESAKHGPHGDYHVHMNGSSNKIIVVGSDGKVRMENPANFTKRERSVLDQLTEGERKYLRQACREVFHGAPDRLPKLQLKHLGRVLTFAGAAAAVQQNTHRDACSAADLTGDPTFCELGQ